jgi:type IV secretory pathway ATPase VirB11/archaellum biosynthesis ATPase
MRADRIVVGEVRGAEALDMIQALTSGQAEERYPPAECELLHTG